MQPDQYEVIVADDGQRPVRDALSREFPFVRWVAGPRRGPAANRNAGAREALGAWLAFTDDDCEPQPDWLNGFSRRLASGVPDALEGKVVSEPAPVDYWEDAPINPSGGFFWTCNVTVKAGLFRAVGGFDENYPTPAMEDIDLKMSIQATGGRIEFCPDAVVNHPARRRTWQQKLRTTRDLGSHVYFGRKWHRRGPVASALYMFKAQARHWLLIPLRSGQRGSLAAIPMYVLGALVLLVRLIPWYRRAARLLPLPPSEDR